MSKVATWFDSKFKLTENKTTMKTEVFAGITTFFAMSYIIVVNPWSMVGGADMSIWNAVFVGSILAAIIGTLLMAFVGKMPYAQAAGMGLNSFFFSQFMLFGTGTSAENYGAGLAIIFLSGILFLLLTVTGLRRQLTVAIPDGVRKAIPAGIGLFIAFLGLQNSGFVVSNEWTMIALVDFTSWASAGPVLAFFLGLIILGVMQKHKVKGAIAISIVATTILYYLMTWTLPDFGTVVSVSAFKDFAEYSLFNLRFDLAFGDVTKIFSMITVILTFCLVDMFDTVGTLYGTAAQAKMYEKDAEGNDTSEPKNLNKCMLCDSVATVVGACIGSSSITTFVESASGVSEGGRTGLTSLVVSIGFFIALFFSPLASIIPGQATAVALVYVGVLMLQSFSEIDMSDPTIAIPAFLTLIVMPLTYSIANGIAVGIIAYELLRLCTLKVDKTDIVPAIIAVLFICKFAFVAG